MVEEREDAKPRIFKDYKILKRKDFKIDLIKE